MTGRFVVVVSLLTFGVGCGDVEFSGGVIDLDPPAKTDARVTRVVDGDTIKVRLAGGQRDTVRYIGIDTPESVKPQAPVECFGPRSTDRNRELVEDEQVRLELGRDARDRYGRILAYVFRTRDGVFVNRTLIAEGFARPLRITPNTRYAEVFSQLARSAERAQRGLWGACRR